jgi:hypothetical protein
MRKTQLYLRKAYYFQKNVLYNRLIVLRVVATCQGETLRNLTSDLKTSFAHKD